MAGQARKLPEVVVGGMHFGSMRERERRDLCIRDKIASRSARGGEQLDNFAYMVFARQQQARYRVGGPLCHQVSSDFEWERFEKTRRFVEIRRKANRTGWQSPTGTWPAKQPAHHWAAAS